MTLLNRQTDRQTDITAYNSNREVMTSVTLFIVIICYLISYTSSARHQTPSPPADSVNTELRLADVDPCYRADGSPTRCIPDFVNAAYEREIVASSTCGNPPVNFCSHHSTTAYHYQQLFNNTAVNRDNDDDDDERRDCVICDARHQHPVSFLTDVNNVHNLTCWVSAAFNDSETNVSLTLSLHKKFEV